MALATNRYKTTVRGGRASGFAYLWVLFLVAFLGLGLSVAAEIEATATQRDKERELVAIGHQFRDAIGRYYEGFESAKQVGGASVQAGGLHEYPASLDDLLEDRRSLGVKRHLRRVYIDPMTGKSEWGLVRVAGRIVGIHSLSDRKPIKQDHFDSEDATCRDKEKYSDWTFTYPPDLLLRGEGSADHGAIKSVNSMHGRSTGGPDDGADDGKAPASDGKAPHDESLF